MLNAILYAMIFFFTLCIAACLYRAVKGPSVPDRIVALDLLGLNTIAIIAIFSVIIGNPAFLDVILLIGILSFIGTISLTRFVERGAIIVRDRRLGDRVDSNHHRDDL